MSRKDKKEEGGYGNPDFIGTGWDKFELKKRTCVRFVRLIPFAP
jgi:hypothetical protein